MSKGSSGFDRSSHSLFLALLVLFLFGAGLCVLPSSSSLRRFSAASFLRCCPRVDSQLAGLCL